MGEHKHKAEGGEKKDKVGQGKKASDHATHPVLQLQQMVGNKAVTNMIQRHTAESKAKARPRIKTSSKVSHPILQLQQIVGNKAVTNMLQRHPNDGASNVRSSTIRFNQSRIDKLVHKNATLKGRVDLLEGVVTAQTGRMNRHTIGGGHRI